MGKIIFEQLTSFGSSRKSSGVVGVRIALLNWRADVDRFLPSGPEGPLIRIISHGNPIRFYPNFPL